MGTDGTSEHFRNTYPNLPDETSDDVSLVIYAQRIRDLIVRHVHCDCRVVDLGCGFGIALSWLNRLGFKHLTGVDYAPVGRFIREGVTLLQCDFMTSASLNLEADFVVCTQVIEHVDEDLLFQTIKSLLRGGPYGKHVLISSIVKPKHPWYIYRNAAGDRVLEPTHIREYESKEYFHDLVQKAFPDAGYIFTETTHLRFPLIDPIAVFVFRRFRIDLLSKQTKIGRFFQVLRRIKVPVPGYKVVETLVVYP